MPSHFFHNVSLITFLLMYLEGAVETIINNKTDTLLSTSCKSLRRNMEEFFACQDCSWFDLCPASLPFDALANISLRGCKCSYFLAGLSNIVRCRSLGYNLLSTFAIKVTMTTSRENRHKVKKQRLLLKRGLAINILVNANMKNHR